MLVELLTALLVIGTVVGLCAAGIILPYRLSRYDSCAQKPNARTRGRFCCAGCWQVQGVDRFS